MSELMLVQREVYTFVDTDGKNTHIDAVALRKWCLSHRDLEVFNTPLDPEFAKRFVEVDNSVSLLNLIRVKALKSWDPLIWGKTGTSSDGAPDVMLIDGHHRYFIAAMSGLKTAPGFVLEQDQWRPFVLDWIPDLTHEELRAAPMKLSARS